MNRLWNILVALLLLAAIVGDFHCIAEGDDDPCTESAQCALCTSSAVAELVAPTFDFFPTPLATLIVESSEPIAPHLALLTPPPKSEI